MNQNRIDFLEGKIEKRKAWISNAGDFILDAEDSIEELQQNIEGWREYIGDKESQINELESELEVLREEQSEQYLNKTSAENRGWHSMKL